MSLLCSLCERKATKPTKPIPRNVNMVLPPPLLPPCYHRSTAAAHHAFQWRRPDPGSGRPSTQIRKKPRPQAMVSLLIVVIGHREPFTLGLRPRTRLLCVGEARLGHSAHDAF